MSYSEDLMNQFGCREDLDVDNIPDSDTREDDLVEIIDFKHSPAFSLFKVLEMVK